MAPAAFNAVFMWSMKYTCDNSSKQTMDLEMYHLQSEGKFLVTKFEFGGSFGMRLEGYYHELEVTPNFELLMQ
jgi:hypothetical protein